MCKKRIFTLFDAAQEGQNQNGLLDYGPYPCQGPLGQAYVPQIKAN